MLNKNLIKTLSTINPITNSIVLQYPVTYGVSEDHAISFKINVSEIDSDDFNDINLNDSLKDFISLFSLFNDFKCKEENGIFTILKRGQCCYIFFAAAAHERASGVFSIFFTYASACGDKKRICLCAYDFFAAFYAGG